MNNMQTVKRANKRRKQNPPYPEIIIFIKIFYHEVEENAR